MELEGLRGFFIFFFARGRRGKGRDRVSAGLVVQRVFARRGKKALEREKNDDDEDEDEEALAPRVLFARVAAAFPSFFRSEVDFCFGKNR